MDNTLNNQKNKLVILSECCNLEILLKNIAKLLERNINRGTIEFCNSVWNIRKDIVFIKRVSQFEIIIKLREKIQKSIIVALDKFSLIFKRITADNVYEFLDIYERKKNQCIINYLNELRFTIPVILFLKKGQ